MLHVLWNVSAIELESACHGGRRRLMRIEIEMCELFDFSLKTQPAL
jgi:hypothetical protein